MRALLASRRAQLALVAGFLAWSVVEAQVSPRALVSPEALEGLGRLLRGLVPPDTSPQFLLVVAGAVVRTLAIGVAGTALAVVLAIPLGILATPTLSGRARSPREVVGGPGCCSGLICSRGGRSACCARSPSCSGRCCSWWRWGSVQRRGCWRSGWRTPGCWDG